MVIPEIENAHELESLRQAAVEVLKQFRKNQSTDPYQFLGISATEAQNKPFVSSVFKKLLRKIHPDRFNALRLSSREEDQNLYKEITQYNTVVIVAYEKLLTESNTEKTETSDTFSRDREQRKNYRNWVRGWGGLGINDRERPGGLSSPDAEPLPYGILAAAVTLMEESIHEAILNMSQEESDHYFHPRMRGPLRFQYLLSESLNELIKDPKDRMPGAVFLFNLIAEEIPEVFLTTTKPHHHDYMSTQEKIAQQSVRKVLRILKEKFEREDWKRILEVMEYAIAYCASDDFENENLINWINEKKSQEDNSSSTSPALTSENNNLLEDSNT